jgi:hypothetical protein
VRRTLLLAGAATVAVAAIAVASSRREPQAKPADAARGAAAEQPAPAVAAGGEVVDARVEVPPPPFSDGIFPCTECHNADMPPNRTRRVLTDMHDDINLRHDEEHRWCLDCHDADDRNVLHLAGGEKVPFDESYRVCGQCHGEKLRDWRAGVHGRRSGQWNGHKTYLLCAHCHSPHQPRFARLAPKPAPRRPIPGHASVAQPGGNR